MRDVLRGDGEGDPPPKPPAPRAEVRFPAAPSGPPEPPPAAPTGGDAEAVFAAVQGGTEALRDAVARGGPLPIAELEAIVIRVIASLERGSELFWLANDPVPAGADYVAVHLTSVGVQALRIGADLGYDRSQLVDLGVAALLSDIGLWKLPPRLLGKAEALTPDEQSQYQTHPRLAVDLIRGTGVERAGLVDSVLEHHEREQGQGYPQGLPGSAIHPHAKIIGLVDTYTRLTAPRPPQARLQPHEAIREIVRSKHESFPSALIKALLSEISVFPPRTLVKLNTGEVGRVVAVNRNHPLRPKVEIVADSKGDRLHGAKLVDLSESPFIYITAPIQESRS
jgi:HD-GYP domain-containing protein (c-di-GMP phosphodiesterase class II)